jgi:hypothetical protein
MATVDAAASQPTPPPATHRGHGAAIAATMVALPATASASSRAPQGATAPVALDPQMQPTPPPVAREHPGDDAGPGRKAATAGGEKGANFRETLWFKKGDVEQMVAEAKAKAAAAAPAGKARPDVAAPVDLPVEDAKPLEDRYLDDGSVTVDDRKKFSLRSGGTATGLPTVGGSMPGERMSETEMLNEMGGRKKIKVFAIAAVAVAALVAVLVVTFKGKGGGDKGAATTAAAHKAAEEAAAAKMPPPAAPEPATAAAPIPEPAHAKEAVAKDGPSAKARAAARKKAAAKKAAAKKKH